MFYKAGDSITEEITAKDGSGVVIDLTGLTTNEVLFRLYENQGSTPLFEKVVGTGITLNADPTTGKFDVVTDTADTTDLPPGTYWAESVVTKGAITYVVMTGQVVIGRRGGSPIKNPQPGEGGKDIGTAAVPIQVP